MLHKFCAQRKVIGNAYLFSSSLSRSLALFLSHSHICLLLTPLPVLTCCIVVACSLRPALSGYWVILLGILLDSILAATRMRVMIHAITQKAARNKAYKCLRAKTACDNVSTQHVRRMLNDDVENLACLRPPAHRN